MPTDPNGTLDRVTGGVLRVGVTPYEDRVVLHENGPPSGVEVELVKDFAETLDADVDWQSGSEGQHVRALEDHELDLIIGGISDRTPWSSKTGVTRPYAEITTEDGTQLKLVMLVQMGENAFLSELETFLTQRGQEASS
ncbi:transporter substrate-binding domain-containing protein [Salinibacterium sp. SYSU T00001]|uniref:transporter substrate-binding domain-containing protein n=1 Tax=Homoserinimonas sedimenticola TaxID=2986805 RepID=UPI0022354776|nr:transporter substrate-binding domain-containing protein [Salinibacterium sedimenticola]MCW4386644.1 transporter substrate-binding domain-containing protein [Salinibacterium sedimenticola]